MINQILHENLEFQKRIAELKSIAPIYPKIAFLTQTLGQMWATCKVEYVYNGIKFSRHHVESLFIQPSENDMVTKDRLRALMNASCQQTIDFAIPCQFDDVIGPTNTSTQNSLPPQKQIESEW